ncbi:7449_t:CDS:2, partial [Funneliformis geosporum]
IDQQTQALIASLLAEKLPLTNQKLDCLQDEDYRNLLTSYQEQYSENVPETNQVAHEITYEYLLERPTKKPVKRTKKAPVKVTTKPTKALALVKTKPTKKTAAYYQCMSNCCQNKISPKKISQVAHECKTNALALNKQMSAAKLQAVKQIKKGYEQLVGYGVFHGHRLNKDCFLCPYRGLIFMGSSVVLGGFLAYTALAMFFNYSLKLG